MIVEEQSYPLIRGGPQKGKENQKKKRKKRSHIKVILDTTKNHTKREQKKPLHMEHYWYGSVDWCFSPSITSENAKIISLSCLAISLKSH